MVIEPTVPGVNDSCSSPISGRCSWYTSLPIFPAVAEIAASSQMNSATPSRAVIHGMSGTPSPSCPANAVQQVQRPVAPELHACPAPRRAGPPPSGAGPGAAAPGAGPSSAAHTAALKPNVMGRPGLPVGPPAHRGVPVLGGELQRAVPHPGHVAFGDVARAPGRPARTRCRTGPARWRRSTPTPAPPVAARRAAPGSAPWWSARWPGSARPPGPGRAGTRRRCARMAAAASGGIRPTSAWAWASAARICSHAWVRPSSLNSADASGVVHRWP